jgi:hypothetical protein
LGICVLSLSETARLEHYGIWPACKAHRHVKKAEAAQMVRDETHRLVGGKDTAVADANIQSMIVEASFSRNWEPVACHAADGMALRGMRTWGKVASK